METQNNSTKILQLVHKLQLNRFQALFVFVLISGLFWATDVNAFPPISPSAQGTSTGTIPYQGRLADSGGTPVTNTYPMIFRLYDVSSEGVSLWEEQWTGSNSVQVSDGLFNVLLGSLTPIPQSVISNHETLYLGITVGTDNEMFPRVQLGSMPYSMQAQSVATDTITSANIVNGTIQAEDIAADAIPPGVPVGTVINWWRPDSGTPLPSDDWAIADGSQVTDPNSPFYGKNLPDLTNRFVMGVATADIGATGGTNTLNLAHSHTVNSHRHQVASHTHSVPNHTHSVSGTTGEIKDFWDGGYYTQSGDGVRFAANTYQTAWYYRHNHSISLTTGGWSGTSGSSAPYTDYQTPGTNSQLSSTTDNRPAYVGLLYLIRIK